MSSGKSGNPRIDTPARRLKVDRPAKALEDDRLYGGQRISNTVIHLVAEQPLQFFGTLSLANIAASAGDSDRLARCSLAFELHQAPGTEPTPACIGLLHAVLDLISAITLRIERPSHA